MTDVQRASVEPNKHEHTSSNITKITLTTSYLWGFRTRNSSLFAKPSRLQYLFDFQRDTSVKSSQKITVHSDSPEVYGHICVLQVEATKTLFWCSDYLSIWLQETLMNGVLSALVWTGVRMFIDLWKICWTRGGFNSSHLLLILWTWRAKPYLYSDLKNNRSQLQCLQKRLPFKATGQEDFKRSTSKAIRLLSDVTMQP